MIRHTHGSAATGALALALAVLAGTVAVRAEDVSLSVSPNRSDIYLGEAVILSVQARGDSGSAEPDVSAILDGQVRYLGSQSSSQYSFQIVNGRIQRQGFTGRTFTYEFTPSRTGEIQAGPVRLTVGGTTVAAEGPRIRVTGIEAQDSVLVEVAASRETAMLDESFDVALRILIRRPDGQFEKVEPLSPLAPPTVAAPFLNVAPIEGLVGPDVQRLLQSLLISPEQAGFHVNQYTVRSDPFATRNFFNFNFDDPFREKPARFGFPREFVERNGRTYVAYSVSLSFTPEQEGNYTFGPAEFKGRILMGFDATGKPVERNVFAVGPAATVRVVPPPEQDRPQSYVGTLGSNLTASAALDAQTCKVGDPLTLTLAISGDVRLDRVFPPGLSLLPGLTNQFMLYEDTVETDRNDSQFVCRFKLRPMRAGTLEIPPIPVSYYDVVARGYRTVATAPIPVQVLPGTEFRQDQIIANTNRMRTIRAGTDRAAPDPAPMRADPAGASSAPLTGAPWVLWTLPIGPAVFGLVVGARAAVAARRRTVPLRRKRSANRRAAAALAEAARMARGDARAARAAAYSALQRFVAERHDVPAGGLTPADARRLLRAQGADGSGDTARLCGIMEQLLAAGYDGVAGGGALAGLCREAADIAARLRLDEPSSPARRFLAILLAAGGTAAVSAQGAEAPAEAEFSWRRANASLAAAQKPEEFLRAAEAYQSLVDMGIGNGPLFYNQGLAFLDAGRHDDAIRCFLRAERHMGAAPDLRQSLRAARARREKSARAPEPWHRTILFWHYGLPCPIRTLIAAAAFHAAWILLLLRMAGMQGLFRLLWLPAVLAFVLFGSSVAASLQQDIAARRPALTGPPAPAQPAAP